MTKKPRRSCKPGFRAKAVLEALKGEKAEELVF